MVTIAPLSTRFAFQQNLSRIGGTVATGAKQFFQSKGGKVATAGAGVGAGGFFAKLGLEQLAEPFKAIDEALGIDGIGFIVLIGIILLVLVMLLK